MPQQFNASAFRQQLATAQRQAEQEIRRAVREAEQHNRRVIADYNRRADAHNRAAERHNQQVVNDLNRQLQNAQSRPDVRYTVEESQLADRVQEAISVQDAREHDVFLSYARIDGSETAHELRANLEDLGVSVWFDAVAIRPGES